jgi:hypothetical protein
MGTRVYRPAFAPLCWQGWVVHLLFWGGTGFFFLSETEERDWAPMVLLPVLIVFCTILFLKTDFESPPKKRLP